MSSNGHHPKRVKKNCEGENTVWHENVQDTITFFDFSDCSVPTVALEIFFKTHQWLSQIRLVKPYESFSSNGQIKCCSLSR